MIVCYEPDVLKLSQLCHRLNNTCEVILVDNSEISYLSDLQLFDNCSIIIPGGNTGIAYAQNIGIKDAIKNDAEVIVFFDQDSVIDDNFLALLIEPLESKIPGIVAPVYYDYDSGFEYPSFRMTKYGTVNKIFTNGEVDPYFVDIVISSGSAATVEVFDIAGLMDEGLYIDFVDTEWCLRCRKKNVPIKIVPKATMKHSIGVGSINLYFITVIIHSPIRCYYQIRNCFHLFRKDSIPILYAVKETMSVLLNKLLLLLFVKNKLTYISNYMTAISNGILGVNGKKVVE